MPADFHPLVDSITYSDYYLLANDFADYVATQVRAARPPLWGPVVQRPRWCRQSSRARRQLWVQLCWACAATCAVATTASLLPDSSHHTCARPRHPATPWSRTAWMRCTAIRPSGRTCRSCPPPAPASSPPTAPSRRCEGAELNWLWCLWAGLAGGMNACSFLLLLLVLRCC